MEQLLSAYLPIVIFIGVALAIGMALLVGAVHRRLQESRSREALGL